MEVSPRKKIFYYGSLVVLCTLGIIVSLGLYFFPAKCACAVTKIVLTSGTSWTVPADWNSANNTIEVIGGGGGGGGNSGGGGGGYSKITNLSLTPGASVGYAIGAAGASSPSDAGGNGGDTYFCNSTSNCASLSDTSVKAGAQGGAGGPVYPPSSGGTGGQASSGVGTTVYSGGNGSGNSGCAGGGGGAAGPNGNGGNGGICGSSDTGGTGGGGGGGGSNGGTQDNSASDGTVGGNNYLSAGGGASTTVSSPTGGNGSAGGGGGGGGGYLYNTGGAGGNGGNGTEWDSTHGSGGGGGGGGYDGFNGFAGGNGGLYGGGGGAETGGTGSGAGGQGIIVITYTPGLPPTVSLTSPSDGAVVSGSAITLSATASDDVGIAGVTFKDSATIISSEVTAPPYSVMWDSTATTSGMHVLTAVARDTAGNVTTSAPITVTVDNVAPAVALIAPSSGTSVAGTVELSVDASDDGGLAGVSFYVNDSQIGSEVTAPPYSVMWDTSALSGPYTVFAVARDEANNYATSSVVSFSVDNAHPTPPASTGGTSGGSGSGGSYGVFFSGSSTPPTGGSGAGSTSPQAPILPHYQFLRTLSYGYKGSDVQMLQIILNALGFVLAQEGPGSPGLETQFFGPLTQIAVSRLQEAYASSILTPLKLSAGTGIFASSTRAFLNKLLLSR